MIKLTGEELRKIAELEKEHPTPEDRTKEIEEEFEERYDEEQD